MTLHLTTPSGKPFTVTINPKIEVAWISRWTRPQPPTYTYGWEQREEQADHGMDHD